MSDTTRVVGKRGKKVQPTLDVDQPTPTVSERGSYRSLAEEIAQSKYFERNKFVQVLKEKFPHQANLWTIDRFFPYAKGGPLFVEEPTYKHEMAESKLKRDALMGQPGRFLIIEAGMQHADVMHQLAEMEIVDGLDNRDN